MGGEDVGRGVQMEAKDGAAAVGVGVEVGREGWSRN